jgi:hypothetical protein
MRNDEGMRLAFTTNRHPSLMKRRLSVIAFLTIGLLLMKPAIAQTPSPQEANELNALINEVQEQQTAIAENQIKIDEKLVTLGDTIREARIFSSRGGRADK